MSSRSETSQPWPAWLAVLKISKVPFWFIWLTPFAYGYLISTGSSPPPHLGWFLLAVCGVCLLESVNCVHNELVDQEEDRINQPHRATLIQSVGEPALWRMVIIGYGAVLVGIIAIGMFVSQKVAICMFLAGMAAPLYNWGPRFKRRPYFAEVAIGWATMFGFLSGWYWGPESHGVPPIAWVVTYFFAITSLMKDLPDARGDEVVRAPGIFSIRKSGLRKALLFFIYTSPYVLIVALVAGHMLPLRLLFILPLALTGLLAMFLGERANSLGTFIVAYELAFLYVHLFMLAMFVLFYPSPLVILVAFLLFVARLTALTFQLAPRFVEPDFSWSRAIAQLWEPA